MIQPKITIIDTGCANLSSVKIALDRLGADVRISADLDDIRNADKLILPGVGSAIAAMKSINERKLADAVREAKQPLLGICLGMQMLGESSEESMSEGNGSAVDCLSVCRGKVSLLETNGLRLPHMGWNSVKTVKEHPLFKGIPEGSYFYFVHSYAYGIGEDTIATCEHGTEFTSVIGRGNFMGTQFHPEKSGPIGAKLLGNFITEI